MSKRLIGENKYCVYILECSDGSYYTGYTNDLKRRDKEHNNTQRGAKNLRGKLPVRVVWSKEYRYQFYAMRAEHKIKQLTRKQKEKLVKGKRLDKVLVARVHKT